MAKSLFLTAVFLVLVCGANAQTYRKGDVILVNAFYGGCVRATITGTDPAYSVHIEEGSYKDKDTFYNTSRIGECKQGAQAAQTAPPARGQMGGMGATMGRAVDKTPAGRLAVGTRVDVYETETRPKDRGTVAEVSGARFRVHYDGCDDKFDTWETADHVKSAASVSATDPDVSYLLGRWSMVISANSSYAIAWGKAPGLQIDRGGSYIWYQDGGRPPVRGTWTPYAKLEGANKFNVHFQHGVIVNDPSGAPWKVFRSTGLHGEDTISINKLCYTSLRQTGFRAK